MAGSLPYISVEMPRGVLKGQPPALPELQGQWSANRGEQASLS